MPLPQEVARRYAAAVVVVELPLGTAGVAIKSQGFFVSSAGLLFTLLPGAHAGDAVSVSGEQDAAGVVVVVDGDGLALVQVKDVVDGAALGVSAQEQATQWLVGLARADAGVQGMLGGRETGDDTPAKAGPNGERWRVLLPVPRGSPILDDKNEIVAVAVKGLGGGLIEALPARRLKVLAARIAKPAVAQASAPP